ncbi:gfo/Idh/MocA family oxidoreductase, partial [Rhizobium leguminosarum]
VGIEAQPVYFVIAIGDAAFRSNDDRTGRRGFREIDVGPENPTFRAFLPLPNFGLGYNESKIIEVAAVIRSIVANRPMW